MTNFKASHIQGPSAAGELTLVDFEAREELGRIVEYDLSVQCLNHELQADDVLGKPLVLSLSATDGGVRYIHAYVTAFTYAGYLGQRAYFKFSLRPWLWFLTLSSRSRFFENKTVLEVIEEVLADYPGEADWQVIGSHEPMEYCVQYCETDFDFFSRLLEEAGLYYFFTHEESNHQLVIVDSMSMHKTVKYCEQMSFRPSQANLLESITEWECQSKLVTGKFSLGDFDFSKAVSREASVKYSDAAIVAKHGHGDYQHVLYPGLFTSQDAGDRAAKVRIEAAQSRRQRVQCRSKSPYLMPGYCFELIDHPQATQNGQYLIVRSTLRAACTESVYGMGDPSFECQVEAIKANQVFRSPIRTQRPIIAGPQTALVVGKAGEELWVDQYGRIKVQFHWDRSERQNESCSCWVRVVQPLSGKSWGAMFLPRVGQEVVVEFLEGNPDRPLVTGSVYNAGTQPPWKLPDEAARSGLKSQSLGAQDVYNELRFEDKAGSEQLLFHAGRNHDLTVRNDALASIGNDWHVSVGANQFIKVAGDSHESVEGDCNIQIGGDRSAGVTGDSHYKIAGKLKSSAGSMDFKGDQTITIEAGTTLTLKAGASTIVLGSSGVAINGAVITIDGSSMVDINGGGGGNAASASQASPHAAKAPKEADDGRI